MFDTVHVKPCFTRTPVLYPNGLRARAKIETVERGFHAVSVRLHGQALHDWHAGSSQ